MDPNYNKSRSIEAPRRLTTPNSSMIVYKVWTLGINPKKWTCFITREKTFSCYIIYFLRYLTFSMKLEFLRVWVCQLLSWTTDLDDQKSISGSFSTFERWHSLVVHKSNQLLQCLFVKHNIYMPPHVTVMQFI